MLHGLNAFIREKLSIQIRQKLSPAEAIGVPMGLFIVIKRGIPTHIRSDKDPELVA